MRTFNKNITDHFPLILGLLMILFSSCEDQFMVRLDRPETEQKMVAFCIIEEGQTGISCTLTKAKAIFGESPDYSYDPVLVTDANITISGNGTSYTLNYVEAEEVYYATVSADFLKKNEEYTLIIESPTQGMMSSKTVIPEIGVTDLSLELDSIILSDGYYEYEEYLSTIRFKDDAGEGDIYNIRAKFLYDSISQRSEYVGFETPYIVDEQNDGAIMERIGSMYKDRDFDYLKFDIILQKVTKDYMLYHQSHPVYSYYYEDDPFTEPVISYSNIEGGLGLFSGVAAKRFEIVVN